MGDVDFGYAVTQDDALIPDRHTLDANVHVWMLDGSAVTTYEFTTGLYLMDTVADGVEIENVASGLWLVNVGGTLTAAQIKAALQAYLVRGGVEINRGSAGRSSGSASAVDTEALNAAETPVALAPGTWTPT